MIKEFKVPSPGESITEVEIASWLVEDGAYINKNDELAEVESDKATLTLVAEESGIIRIKVSAGQTIPVGSVAYTIDTDAKTPEKTTEEKKAAEHTETPSPTPEKVKTPKEISDEHSDIKVTPVAARMMEENHLSVDDIINGLRRITKQDVASNKSNKFPENKLVDDFSRETERSKMTMLRKRLSERLVKVKNETAMLTTFNEIDMSELMNLRSKVQNSFVDKYGFKLGFMGFFTKAVSIASLQFPMVNSMISGDEIVTPSYSDVGIAVQTEKGLMVPVVRNAESKSVAPNTCSPRT